MCRLVDVVPDQVDTIKQAATIPLVLGGLDLRSVVQASWTESLPMVRERHPAVADTTVPRWRNIRTRLV